MLKQLRQKKVMKRILWVLALLIIPAFVLWGAGGLRESGNDAGTIFGKRISFNEYRDSLNAVKNRSLITYGTSFYQIQDKLNLEDAAWDYLIMLKEAKQNRIKVSDKEVIERIASFAFFKDKEGSFNPKAYEMVLNSAFRTPPRQFEEEMRQSLMIERLIQGVLTGIPEPTDAEIDEAIKKETAEEGKEETAEQKRERIRNELAASKKFEAYQQWHEELRKRANLVSNIEKEEPPQEIPITKKQ